MAYAAWSVVAFEQPTTAKWNILGTNDASFNDGTGLAITNNQAIQGYNAAAALQDITKIDGSDVLQIGDAGLNGIQFEQSPDIPIYYYSTDTTINYAPGVGGYADIAGWTLNITLDKTTDVLIRVAMIYSNNDQYGFSLKVVRDSTDIRLFSSAIREGEVATRNSFYGDALDENVVAGTYAYKIQLAPSGSTAADIDMVERSLTLQTVEKF